MYFKQRSLTAWVLSFLLFLGGFLLPACQPAKPPLLVAAAISLKPVMQKLQAAYPEGDALRFSFASSGVIRQQIIQGAPYAIFLSAGTQEIDKLAKVQITGDTYTLAHNPLVTARLESEKPACAPQDLSKNPEAKIAIGNPRTVPVGYTAQQALGEFWKPLQPQIVFTEHAYQNIVYLRNQAVDYAVIYQSDLKAYPQMKACWHFGQDSGVTLTALALPGNSPHSLTSDWLQFLQSPAAQAIWETAGFTLRTSTGNSP